jgi:hypothetical protein
VGSALDAGLTGSCYVDMLGVPRLITFGENSSRYEFVKFGLRRSAGERYVHRFDQFVPDDVVR